MEKESFIFRRAEIDDILSVIKLIENRCLWMKENGINQWDEEYLKFYNFNYFKERVEKRELFLVENFQKIVGTFVLLEEDERWENDMPAYYIHNFATDTKIRGIGSEIIEYCEDLCRENSKKTLRLDCNINNNKLNDYYEKKGFKTVGICDESPEYVGYKREKIIF